MTNLSHLFSILYTGLKLVKEPISFDDAKHIFSGPLLTRLDDREDYGEDREISIGMLSPDAILVVVHVERGNNIRLISARIADQRERMVFYDYLARTFEGD